MDCDRCGVDHRRGSPECPAARVGRTVAGKYAIVRLVGAGGMGAVYEARHLQLGSTVALKMLHARYCDSAEVVERFHQEAQRAARLRHPGIVDIRDLGVDTDGSAYVEMELLAGESLADALTRGPMPIATVVDIGSQVLDALDAAHEAGLVHRDIKPDNIFLARGRRNAIDAKLLDFGIAKTMTDSAGLTRSGAVLGTPLYMSPEQATSSKHVDRRADIYSLGATMYEMLAGQAPVAGDSLPQILLKVVSGDVRRRVRDLRPDVPTWLDAVVARALATDPAQRWPTARAMLAALDAGLRSTTSRTLESSGPGAPSAPPAPVVAAAPDMARSPRTTSQAAGEVVRRRVVAGRRWVLAGGLAVAAIAIGVAIGLRQPGRPAPSVERTVDAAIGPAIASGPGPIDAGAIDGAVADTAPVGMVPVKAGWYPFGCQAGDSGCRDDERPGTRLTLPTYFIDAHEVTSAQYGACVAAGACSPPGRTGPCAGVVEVGNHPVRCVSWKAAVTYCGWRHLRLPTEVEWEVAARGLSRRDYPWDSTPPTCLVTWMFGQRAGCGTGSPGPVGSRVGDRSWCGAFDLGGNVREWVADPYGAYEDGHVEAAPGARVNRGGSYLMRAAQFMTAHGRNSDGEDVERPDLGFRCASSSGGRP